MRQVFAAFAMSGSRTVTGFKGRNDRESTGATTSPPTQRRRLRAAANGASGKR